MCVPNFVVDPIAHRRRQGHLQGDRRDPRAPCPGLGDRRAIVGGTGHGPVEPGGGGAIMRCGRTAIHTRGVTKTTNLSDGPVKCQPGGIGEFQPLGREVPRPPAPDASRPDPNPKRKRGTILDSPPPARNRNASRFRQVDNSRSGIRENSASQRTPPAQARENPARREWLAAELSPIPLRVMAHPKRENRSSPIGA